MSGPTPEMLRELLDYNPETGKLTWRKRSRAHFSSDNAHAAWNARYAEMPAFAGINNTGYACGYIFDKGYLAHRVGWAIYYGQWPIGQIDHINHDRKDNRIVNLRDIPAIENRRNLSLHRNNTSGQAGVHFGKERKKWIASIRVCGRLIHLGAFEDFSDAVAAREIAERQYGFHENHGRGSSARKEVVYERER